MTIVREEIFGPVVTILIFKTEEEAVALANDTVYGLAGAVFTSDGSRALRVMKEIRAGITWINCYNPTFNEAPGAVTKCQVLDGSLVYTDLRNTRR
jgi:betaine-aldehyde dehydrogenase